MTFLERKAICRERDLEEGNDCSFPFNRPSTEKETAILFRNFV